MLLILAFIAVYFLVFYLHIWEVLSVWSCGTLKFDQSYPFYTVVGFGSNFLMLLVGFQLLWTASIIKESFNFIASSHAANWYFKGEASYLTQTMMLFRYHWGSVVGGSLLHALFYFVDLVIDFLFSTDAPERVSHDNSKVVRNQYQISDVREEPAALSSVTGCCSEFFSLVRG